MSKNIKDLILGYKQFRETYFQTGHPLYEKLSTVGQEPKVMVIACSDSRVDPAIVLNCQPGDLFVVRNVANLVPPYEADTSHHGTSAALEFAVCNLNIEHIIVFGHTQCGGIRFMLEGAHHESSNSFLGRWMGLAKPAHEIVEDQYTRLPLEQKINTCAQYAIINSLKNLKTFPWIQERLEQNRLVLHGWIFDITTGDIKFYDEETHLFHVLKVSVLHSS